MQLQEFFDSPYRNGWIQYKTLRIYVRKGQRYFPDTKMVKTFEIASIVNTRRPDNCDTNLKKKRTGLLSEFINHVEKTLDPSYDGIFIENVLNEFLPEKFVKYGFSRLPTYELPCFFKKRTTESCLS